MRKLKVSPGGGFQPHANAVHVSHVLFDDPQDVVPHVMGGEDIIQGLAAFAGVIPGGVQVGVMHQNQEGTDQFGIGMKGSESLYKHHITPMGEYANR